MPSRMIALLAGFALITLFARSVAIGDDLARMSDSTSADTSATLVRTAPESLQTADQPVTYDDFVDENKNGIDDKYETIEKSKVKVQLIHAPTKPNRGNEPDSTKKADTP